MDYEDRIIVIDSYPGSGKTSWAIQKINEIPESRRFVYITPYLNEIKRIISNCPDKKIKQPDAIEGNGSKMNHLLKLIQSGINIVSTHALFSKINDDLIDALQVNGYILFLDEVFQTVERYDIVEEDLKNEIKDKITRQDVETLISQGLIKVEEDFRIKWIDKNKSLSKYNNLMSLADRDILYFVNGSLLLWTFPIEVFREGIFEQIYILTHRFESQLQSYYYKYFNLEYCKYYVYKNNNEYKIEKGISNDSEWKLLIKQKIKILEDDRLNKVGDIYKDSKQRNYQSALSKTWYENKSHLYPIVKNNLTNFFVNISKSKSSDRLWTCFQENINDLRSKNVTKKFWLACNARATNDYANKKSLAYVINRYVDPFYDDFFEHKNISINQDEYAVSEMMQWIWRSAIRNDEEIFIYIPSLRMRTLLKQYLNDEKIEF